jgi:hypothetical protein
VSDRVLYTVIVVGERLTRRRDPSVPLSGGPMAIFAPTVVQAETVIECVGVYTTLEKAQSAAAIYIEKNTGHRVKIKAAVLDAAEEAPVAPAGQVCTGCGRPIAGGGLCKPCQDAHWAACRESDPELLEQLQAVTS